MTFAPITLVVVTLSLAQVAHAYDVTTADARRLTLLQYVADRDDLSATDKKAWDKALRQTFGGAAIKDGTDEGITVAKSVISGAIFYGIAPGTAATAAYDAYHDTARWVPPPIAINYQLLAFQGRKPKVTARELAFRFPRYFNEEMAPELVAWWDSMLQAGKINPYEVNTVKDTLQATRALMRPMLLRKLWQGAELEARRGWLDAGNPARAEVDAALTQVERELTTSFRGVGKAGVVQDNQRDYYARYCALAQELHEKAAPKPVLQPAPPSVPLAAEPPKAEPPKAEPKVAVAAPKAVEPAPSTAPEGMAEASAVAQQEAAQADRAAIAAPLPGDPLARLKRDYSPALNRAVDAWVGTPYVFGGVDHRGIDCSAFVRAVYRQSVNVELPRNSQEQANLGTGIDKTRLRLGDLVFFDTLERGRVTHVAVYLGDGTIAHASSSKGVIRADFNAKYFQRAFWSSRRLLDAAKDSVNVSADD